MEVWMTDLQLLILVGLSFLDAALTYNWAKYVLSVKPTTPVSKVESNPFIVACWNNYGLTRGSIISWVVLVIVQFLISMIHLYAYYVILVILVFANLNHLNNFLKFKAMLEGAEK